MGKEKLHFPLSRGEPIPVLPRDTHNADDHHGEIGENDLGLADHKILADAAGNDDDDDEEQRKKDAASAGSKGKYALAGAVAAAGTTAAISAAANA